MSLECEAISCSVMHAVDIVNVRQRLELWVPQTFFVSNFPSRLVSN